MRRCRSRAGGASSKSVERESSMVGAVGLEVQQGGGDTKRAIARLDRQVGMNDMRSHISGISRSSSYAHAL